MPAGAYAERKPAITAPSPLSPEQMLKRIRAR